MDKPVRPTLKIADTPIDNPPAKKKRRKRGNVQKLTSQQMDAEIQKVRFAQKGFGLVGE